MSGLVLSRTRALRNEDIVVVVFSVSFRFVLLKKTTADGVEPNRGFCSDTACAMWPTNRGPTFNCIRAF